MNDDAGNRQIVLDRRAPPSSQSEDEFLKRQASDATAAMRQTIRELLNVRTHVSNHPWWSVSAACLAGVAAGRASHRRSRSPADAQMKKLARNKSLAMMALTTILGEAVKFLLPTLFGGSLLGITTQTANAEPVTTEPEA